MAKEMFSNRIDSDLTDALKAEALSERRSVANMLEWILRERYSRAVTERVGAVVSRSYGAEPSRAAAADVAPRSVTAAIQVVDDARVDVFASPLDDAVDRAIQDVPVRAHMKKHRPAVECPTRIASGVCPDCGREV